MTRQPSPKQPWHTAERRVTRSPERPNEPISSAHIEAALRGIRG
ncbi:hypothetical protein [Agrococcus casei]|uniref:Uncharacterized protein n=1 Tax=Agrococcus casei LMG 22410 TaxID=1255656 RepID=A0A1R4G8B2_9MICO|nr:hypothetical protein [Agrococcus casei]SJM64434.1 hypothetical protein CZ674_09800 [Agrococcus casei LMG 22410]